MGGYLKWMKSLIGMKKHESNEHLANRGACHTRKWKLWRNSSMSESLRSDENKAAANHFSAVVNAIVRAPLKDFQALRKQWAAIRIQTYFRGFLKSAEGAESRGQDPGSIPRSTGEEASSADTAVHGIPHTSTDSRAHAAFEASSSPQQSMPALEVASLKNHHELNNCNDGCNCLERYMEARISERYYNKHDKRLSVADARYSDQGQKKNFITDDSSKVQLDKKCKEYFRNCLAPTSELRYGKNSESTSIWTPSSVSSATLLASEETDVSSNHQPNYMSLTESIKAKHMSCYAQRMSRSCGELRHCRRAALSDIEPRSSVSLDWRIQPSPFKERRSFSVKGMEKENDC